MATEFRNQKRAIASNPRNVLNRFGSFITRCNIPEGVKVQGVNRRGDETGEIKLIISPKMQGAIRHALHRQTIEWWGNFVADERAKGVKVTAQKPSVRKLRHAIHIRPF